MPPPPPETDLEYFGPEYDDGESSTLSTKESMKDERKTPKTRPASCYTPKTSNMSTTGDVYFYNSRSKRPESWDMTATSRPRSCGSEDYPMTTFSGTRKKVSTNTLKMQIEE